MPDGPQTIAQRVRAKYPGEYDDLSDIELERKVLAKFPEYDDLPKTEPTLTQERQAPGTPSALESGHAEGTMPTHPYARAGRAVGDLVVGAGKELASQGIAGGAVLRKIPGVNSLDALVKPIEVDTRQSNPTQELGGTALNVAEIAAPAARLTRAGLGVAGKGLARASVAAARPSVQAAKPYVINVAGSFGGPPVGAAAHLATSPKALATGARFMGRVGGSTAQVPADLFRVALLKALGGAEPEPEQP